ncbi:uncharacterized protein LOC114361689 [Ostrinia furnacalis]|uniref:uncharacterized protein LOC114361689 n=1 Tax=Ostrinia furnacalis TaxID=93504 RepID=UPI00103D504A|nr:uncharacterized protein LOC114361689 [Ostrinia furnacalis]
MEGCATDGSPPATCEDTLKENDSIVNFQKFIYELFEKNGILNDLRAYLRGHIIDVLKSSQTGEPPTCQKHFTQRLELTYQALNMLIAEYLLRLEFSYSLSVFVSEIPLANMVFGFAKKLMLTNTGDFGDLKFKDSDVWSILNYLGVKCDSEHASSILEVYNSKENLPLLLCILKCMPMYNIMHKESAPIDQVISSSDSLSSSLKSDMPDDCKMQAKSASKIGAHEKCKHYVFCKTCQSRMHRLKEKYKMKKKNLIKDIKSCETNPLNVETLMKNIDVMEKSLVDEMFQQLKSVYETEVEMMKQEEEKKIKRSLASHAIQLEKRRDEMEESFKAREEELERNVQEKKKFLWGLARALRDQHANMSRAMHAVKNETERLTAKEDSLKSQLLEAEEILRKRGEEMRKHISSELMILEDHLQSMKRERESIHRERSELENLKAACNSSTAIKMQDLNNEELRSHYDLLKNELTILKKYLESTKLEPRCVIERSTLTELSDVTSKIHLVLNNAHDVERVPLKTDSEERIRTPNKVVNDLKKQKNVNFCTSNVDELYRESARDRDRSRSRSSASSDACPVLAALREENERLKTFARQQREHIDELSSHQARLQAELTAARFQAAGVSRPRTAPTLMPATPFLERLNTSASVNSVGWRKGAGEEISMFSNAQPRILLPGDTLPFVGVLRDRHNDNRRYLINQWRALRRRMSPIGGVGKVRNPVAVPRERVPREPRSDFNPVLSSTTTRTTPLESQPQEETEDMTHMNRTFTFQAYPRERPKTAMVTEHPHQSREKSPKTVLREAKEKLRNQSYTKDNTPTTTREKSPSAVLREAKLRLRKLEIEAEAVEKSYLDFRKRQSEMKQGRSHLTETSVINKDIIGSLDIHRSRSHHRPEDNYRMESIPHFTITHDEIAFKKDFEKYLCEYQTKFNASASHFKNNSVVGKSKPIPEVYSKIEPELKEPERRDNYLETPLTEFRKLYHSQRSPSPTLPIDIPRRAGSPEKSIEIDKISNKDEASTRESSESRSKSSRSGKRKKNELEILKDNFGKMYNLQDNAEIEQKIDSSLGKSESPKQQEKNETDLSLREVEQISETHSLNVVESNAQGDLLLVVESTVDTREIDVSHSEIQHEKISTQMTIIVSPKRSVPDGIKECLEKSPRTERSVSPEQAARLTRNDVLDAIFHADASKRQSSVEMELNISKDLIEDSMSDYEKGAEDYPDDFSADVDNYNSRSDYDNRSPISLPKTSEDDNFWDS